MKPILVEAFSEHPGFRDHGQVFALAVQQGDVGKRSALDGDKVGACAGHGLVVQQRSVWRLSAGAPIVEVETFTLNCGVAAPASVCGKIGARKAAIERS
jgi:hypothetical protein